MILGKRQLKSLTLGQWMLAALFGLGSLTVSAVCTLYALFFYFPQQYAEAQWTAPWVAENVNVMDFQSAGQFSQAQHSLKTAIFKPEYEKNPIPRMLIADLFDMMGKTSAAQFFYEDTLRISENNWVSRQIMKPISNHAHAQLALIYYKDNKPQASLQEIQRIENWDENSENTALLQALRDRLEHPQRAEFHLKLAQEFKQELMVDLAQRELNLANHCGGSLALELKMALFQKLEMPKHPETVTPLVRYYLQAGNILSHVQNHQGAKHFYLKAMKESPQFEWTYNALANTHQELGNLTQARRYAQMALNLNPDFYHPHLLLGDIAVEEARYQEAVNHFEAGQRIMSKSPDGPRLEQWVNVENQLAYAFEQLKAYDKAAEHYLGALNSAQASDQALDAEYEYAQAGLRRLSGHS